MYIPSPVQLFILFFGDLPNCGSWYALPKKTLNKIDARGISVVEGQILLIEGGVCAHVRM